MEFREAEEGDLPQLAVWNEQLVEDENAPLRIERQALESRLRGWLA